MPVKINDQIIKQVSTYKFIISEFLLIISRTGEITYTTITNYYFVCKLGQIKVNKTLITLFTSLLLKASYLSVSLVWEGIVKKKGGAA